MPTLRPLGTALPLLVAVLLAACADDTPAPVDSTQSAAVGDVACVAGTGGTGLTARLRCPVNGRFTAELTTLTSARGTFVYTSTWGRRTGATCGATNCGNVVYVWSVGGASPGLVDSLVVADVSTTTTTGDVQVSDDGTLLVVATEPTGSIATYSLADPAHPVALSRYSTADMTNGVHTAQVSRVNGTQYAFCSIDPRGGTRAKLVVVDLSDPRAPRQVFARTMGNPYVHDVFVRDGYLFTALWNDGVTIWDVGARGRGTPAAPDSLGTVRTVDGQAHNVWWMKDPQTGSARWLFVGEEGPGTIGASSEGDVHVVDVADVTKPREVAFYHVAGAGTHNFSVDEAKGVLYAAFYNAGVRALDVRGDLATCTAAQRSADGRCDLGAMGRELARGLADGSTAYVWGVEYANGALYASDMLGGLWRLDAVAR
ncbi:MAG: hypothetical protein JO180_07995 [Gemmatirosa sp.]|nr:hypothetical protein [Gemmatirosa sp.]